jgi:hypothetical protein
VASSCGDELDQRALLLLRCVCGCDVALGGCVLGRKRIDDSAGSPGGGVCTCKRCGALLRARSRSRSRADGWAVAEAQAQAQMGVVSVQCADVCGCVRGPEWVQAQRWLGACCRVLRWVRTGIAQRVKTGGMHMRDTSRGHPLCLASARAQGQGQGQHEHKHEHSGRTGSWVPAGKREDRSCSGAVQRCRLQCSSVKPGLT